MISHKAKATRKLGLVRAPSYRLAMIDGEATVKTFSKKDGHYWLLPANDNYSPIPADNAEILGKVTAVLRSVR